MSNANIHRIARVNKEGKDDKIKQSYGH